MVMDRFFKMTENTYTSKVLHLVGITSMVIASKFEDHKTIKIENMINKICSEKFLKIDISMMEREILMTLEFQIAQPTVLDFLKIYLDDVFCIQILGREQTKSKEL